MEDQQVPNSNVGIQDLLSSLGKPFNSTKPVEETPYSLSNMLKVEDLLKLFESAKTDPKAAANVRALGPGIANLPTSKREGPQQPAEAILPTGRRMDTLMAPEGEEEGLSMDFSKRDPEPEKEQEGTDWSSLAGMASIGLTDLGNALSDRPNAQGGGAMYDLIKDKMQQEQAYKLKARQGMWEENYRISQELPAELLADPEFGELAQAKAALDKDLADGQIDNEKTVQNFNMAFQRSKHTIQAKLQEQQDEISIGSAQRTGGAAAQFSQLQGLQQRQRLEEIAADGSNPLAGPARQELEKLKMTDMQTENIGGRDITAPGETLSKWHLDQAGQDPDRKIRREGNRISDGYRRDAMQDRASARSASNLRGMLQNSMSRIERELTATAKATMSDEPISEEKIIGRALEQNQEAIEQAATAAGLPFQRNGSAYVIDGNVYPLKDPKALSEALWLLYQRSGTYVPDR